MSRLAIRLGAVATAGLVIVAATLFRTAGAAGDIYAPGATGYDISYPQCKSGRPNAAFAILGVNRGRPFRYNECLREQWRAAPKSPLPGLYVNTGYDKFYEQWVTGSCRDQSHGYAGDGAIQDAWAIGCSEGATAIAYARAQGTSTPGMWWLDVETDNSWSTSRLELNRAVLQGVVDALVRAGTPVGIYSKDSWWIAITGGSWNPGNAAANWLSGAKKSSASSLCDSTGFSAKPIWLVQYIDADVDKNYVCPGPWA